MLQLTGLWMWWLHWFYFILFKIFFFVLSPGAMPITHFLSQGDSTHLLHRIQGGEAPQSALLILDHKHCLLSSSPLHREMCSVIHRIWLRKLIKVFERHRFCIYGKCTYANKRKIMQVPHPRTGKLQQLFFLGCLDIRAFITYWPVHCPL